MNKLFNVVACICGLFLILFLFTTGMAVYQTVTDKDEEETVVASVEETSSIEETESTTIVTELEMIPVPDDYLYGGVETEPNTEDQLNEEEKHFLQLVRDTVEQNDILQMVCRPGVDAVERVGDYDVVYMKDSQRREPFAIVFKDDVYVDYFYTDIGGVSVDLIEASIKARAEMEATAEATAEASTEQ